MTEEQALDVARDLLDIGNNGEISIVLLESGDYVVRYQTVKDGRVTVHEEHAEHYDEENEQ